MVLRNLNIPLSKMKREFLNLFKEEDPILKNYGVTEEIKQINLSHTKKEGL